jgi:trk system potassium uptake protein TrkH
VTALGVNSIAFGIAKTMGRLSGYRHLHPSVVLVGSFGGMILLGTLLLSLPVSSAGAPITFLQAFFTATSAVCVTGLVVVDTGAGFSLFGQCVILLLIQAGGLGIMTFAVFVALALGRKISFQDRIVIQDSMHHSPTSELRKLVRYILMFAFGVEALGALLLWLRWRHALAGGQSVYFSIFHSISAFCNAGFSPFRNSLMTLRGDVVTNLVVTGLVIVGGLGFLVNMELRDKFLDALRGRRRSPVSVHTKLVLSVTGWLLLIGMAVFLMIEWTNLLRGLPLGEKILAAWFQAVTPRTAGFNTLDYGKATSATLLLTMFLMFVGASPGSTGGGVKTTALGLFIVLLRARWSGRGRAMAFHRTIPHPVMDRALTLTIFSFMLVSSALLALLLTEHGRAPHVEIGTRFVQLSFETISAFGTVGLSTGLTPDLTAASQCIVIFLMFIGRVGPLTVALAAGRKREQGRYRYAEENVMVG